MDVFVTGATGVLGAPTVRRLLDEGHGVRALARSEANTIALREAGAEAVVADLFDLDSMTRAIEGSEAVLHLATKIPSSPLKVRSRRGWAENDRIRVLGTRNVVGASLATGAHTVVYPSFFAIYADAGDHWIDAESGAVDPLWFLDSNMKAEADVSRFAAAGGRGVSLRMALFFGPESSQTRDMLASARRGLAMIPGPAEAYVPSIWVQDAAEAVVAALRAPSGIYDVVDDEPLTRVEYADALAGAVGRKHLRRPPMLLVRLMAGAPGKAMARSLRISNRRFKEQTGWAPSVRNAREGLARIAAATGPAGIRSA